jgi:hypothetical protein
MMAEEVQAVQNVLYFNYTKEKTLLQFHGNCGYVNVAQCYVMHKLLVFLIIRFISYGS